MQRKSRKVWWHEGVQFACQGSGKCCVSRGAYGYVYLTLEDRRRLAATLGLPTGQFTRKYCAKRDGLFHLKDSGPDCVFLEDKRCSVYEGRPTQCRTWPFWEENLPEEVWKGPVKECCPGIDEGPLVPAAEVERIARETEEWFEPPARRARGAQRTD